MRKKSLGVLLAQRRLEKFSSFCALSQNRRDGQSRWIRGSCSVSSVPKRERRQWARRGEASGGSFAELEMQLYTRNCDGSGDRAGLHLRFMVVKVESGGEVARVMVVSLEDGPWKHG